jgi:hypothetical protein
MKTAFEDWLASTKQLPGAGGAASILTIASDQVTPTTGVHLLETQGAASTDNLAQILQTNMPEGSLLFLSLNQASHQVVVKHAAGGTGQILLVNSVDFTLTSTPTTLVLRRFGTNWQEVGRWFGDATAAHRAFYGVTGLGQNSFTGRQDWRQGNDLASASTITLGTDGNYFNVTGTATVNGLSSLQAGAVVRLKFASSGCKLVNSATFILQVGSYLTRAGDVLEFVSEGAGVWREQGPIGATRVLDIATTDQVVSASITETAVYTRSIPGGALGTGRRLRLMVNGRWSFGTVQTFGSATVYGTRLRLKYGATTIADAFIPGGVWDGSANAYAYGATACAISLVCNLSADGATNAQVGHISGGALPGPGGGGGPAGGFSSVVTTFGILLGQVWNDVNGVLTSGRGTATEDSTADKNLVLTVEHNFNNANNLFALEHAVLEVLP